MVGFWAIVLWVSLLAPSSPQTLVPVYILTPAPTASIELVAAAVQRRLEVPYVLASTPSEARVVIILVGQEVSSCGQTAVSVVYTGGGRTRSFLSGAVVMSTPQTIDRAARGITGALSQLTY